MNPDKVATVAQWPTPSTKSDVRAFTGLAGYYRKFVRNFATIAKPLTELTEKNATWKWLQVHADAFQQLKQAITTGPILAYPDYSTSAAPFVLDVDASDFAIAGILSQTQDGIERVISYGHKTLNLAQQRYCATQKELLTLWYFLLYYSQYVQGKATVVRTDHQALVWLRKARSENTMLGRWNADLESIGFPVDGEVQGALETLDWKVEHRPGNRHTNADGLSKKGGPPRKDCQHADCPSCSFVTANISANETPGDLHATQRATPDWRELCDQVAKNNGRPSDTVWAGWEQQLQVLTDKWGLLHIYNGLLHRKNKSGHWRIVVPEAAVLDILHLNHDMLGAVHKGAKKLTY